MDIVRQSLAVLVVFALLWAALWLVRRKGWVVRSASHAPRLLESRGKLVLTARHSIHVIRIGDRDLIIALHPDGVTFLGDIQPAACSKTKETATR